MGDISFSSLLAYFTRTLIDDNKYIFNQSTRDSYKNNDWFFKFKVMKNITKRWKIDLNKLDEFHQVLCELGQNNCKKIKTESFKKVRSVNITIYNTNQTYVELMEEDLGANEDLNRLTRKFGSDNFLKVKFISQEISIYEKLKHD